MTALRQRVEALEQSATELDDAELRAQARDVLCALSEAGHVIERKARGYPNGAINASVWLDGAALGPAALRMAVLLRSRDLLDLEEAAHVVRCTAVLAVHGHLHHMVGPAMLARGDCAERRGDQDTATACYEAIVGDFSWLLDDVEPVGTPPSDEERAALESLLVAVERRMELPDADGAALDRLLDRCRGVLERGVSRP